MNEYWPWLVLAGLGAFHGLNPAMGWLFAVALGLHRNSRVIIMQALPAIALGHAASIAIVAGAVVLTGLVIKAQALLAGGGILLIGWAIYHQLYGHRHRVRVGMRTGLAGLALWSFVMATAHGAGLMVLPALIPLCLADSPLGATAAEGSIGIALVAVGIHTAAMLVVTGAIAVAVREWLGLAVLRSAWINFDWLWTAGLALAGIILLVSAHPS
ncbi:hypothetical protein [Dongia deserti]|uniref:hypothetical protein n=1 Tax=Dongia deserti TaxID=2268030 RepID=UPI000E6569BF|nr:hypothetical protein [Dongia deserti]